MMRGRAGPAFAAVALAGVMALAVFPARALLAQRHDRSRLAAKEAELGAQNAALQDRAAQLQTDAEIERLARRYNLVKPGEETYFILPRPDAPAAAAPAGSPAPTAPSPAPRPPSLWDRFTSLF
jgi:cell division protein FtsB